MDPFSALMLGSTALSGISSIFGGRSAKRQAKKAAQIQAERENLGIERLMREGDQYNEAFDELAGAYDPYVQSGLQAQGTLDRLIADPSSLRSLPGYQFLLDEGDRAISGSAAARGMTNSGRTLKSLERFAQGTADQTFQNQFNRLYAVGNQGLGAMGNQVNTRGQGLTGRLNARTNAANVLTGQPSPIAQGMIAGANASAQGRQGGFDALMSGIGMLRGSSFAQPTTVPTFGGLY